MVVTEENWGTERHTCLNASWFGAGSTSTDLVSNSAPPTAIRRHVLQNRDVLISCIYRTDSYLTENTLYVTK